MLSTLRSRSGARLARGFASKEIFHGAEARARMLAGANKLADAVPQWTRADACFDRVTNAFQRALGTISDSMNVASVCWCLVKAERDLVIANPPRNRSS